MNMKWYWAKIGLTAAAIFAVGFSVISAFRATKRRVVDVVEGTGDLTIPLPFVPFSFDGERLGTFRKLVIHRSGPERVTGVDVTIRLADPSQVTRLSGCRLTVDDPTRLNEHSSFRCAGDDSSMQAFGAIEVQTKDASGSWVPATTVPLAMPADAIRRIRGEHTEAAVLEVETDRFRQIGDSLGVLGRAMARATTDSARGAIEDQMSDLKDQMAELQDAVNEAARAKAEARVTRVRAKVAAPEPPRPPSQ